MDTSTFLINAFIVVIVALPAVVVWQERERRAARQEWSTCWPELAACATVLPEVGGWHWYTEPDGAPMAQGICPSQRKAQREARNAALAARRGARRGNVAHRA